MGLISTSLCPLLQPHTTKPSKNHTELAANVCSVCSPLLCLIHREYLNNALTILQLCNKERIKKAITLALQTVPVLCPWFTEDSINCIEEGSGTSGRSEFTTLLIKLLDEDLQLQSSYLENEEIYYLILKVIVSLKAYIYSVWHITDPQ